MSPVAIIIASFLLVIIGVFIVLYMSGTATRQQKSNLDDRANILEKREKLLDERTKLVQRREDDVTIREDELISEANRLREYGLGTTDHRA